MNKRSLLSFFIFFASRAIAQEPGFVVIVNGQSSSGKTSITRALSYLLPVPTLGMGVDTIFDMLPLAKKSTWFKPVMEQTKSGQPAMRLVGTPLGKKLCRTLAQTVRLLAEAGNNVVVDEVIEGEEELYFYVDALEGIKVYFVGVFCDIDVLEIREAIRGNRPIGIARGQINYIHQRPRFYDLELDSARQNPLACADQVITLIERNQKPKSFEKLRAVRTTTSCHD